MSFNHTASSLAPLLLRQGTRTAFRRTLQHQRQLPAIAILVPRRLASTETSTPGGSANYPPPGFDPEQAKKPLPKDAQQTKSTGKDGEQKSQVSKAMPNVSIPSHKPTEHPPTTAAEALSLNELASQKAAKEKSAGLELKKKEEKKLTLGQKIMKEVHHYWDGTKLLATEVRISSKLALKMAAGYELTRREHRQVSCLPGYHETGLTMMNSFTVRYKTWVDLCPFPSL